EAAIHRLQVALERFAEVAGEPAVGNDGFAFKPRMAGLVDDRFEGGAGLGENGVAGRGGRGCVGGEAGVGGEGGLSFGHGGTEEDGGHGEGGWYPMRRTRFFPSGQTLKLRRRATSRPVIAR